MEHIRGIANKKGTNKKCNEKENPFFCNIYHTDIMSLSQ